MEKTGRYLVVDDKTGRKFMVEPIGDSHVKWGDVNPATKKVEGGYGETMDIITEKDSIIKEENGFKNIIDLEPGVSPESYISNLLKQQ